MVTWILCAAAIWMASPPAAEVSQRPAVVLVFLDAPEAGAVERLSTMLALIPQIRLLPRSAFPEDRQEAVRKAISGVAPYPDPVARAVLEKHIQAAGAVAGVIVAGNRIHLQHAKTHHGPYAMPGPSGKLPDPLVERLCSLSQRERGIETKQPATREPFYRNWLFWTGVGIIAGTMVAVSILSQDTREVEVEVINR